MSTGGAAQAVTEHGDLPPQGDGAPETPSHPHSPQEICAAHGSAFAPPAPLERAAVALATLSLTPLNARRITPERGHCGWYIWGGESQGQATDFFQTVHVAHLPKRCPQLMPYLALAPGFRVVLGEAGEAEVVSPNARAPKLPRRPPPLQVGPPTSRWVALSIVLHLLAFVLLGDTTGSGRRGGAPLLGPLTVSLAGRPAAPEATPLIRETRLRSLETPTARAPAAPVKADQAEAPVAPAPAPPAVEPEAPAPPPFPPVIAKEVDKPETNFVVPPPPPEPLKAAPLPPVPQVAPAQIAPVTPVAPAVAPVIPPPPVPLPITPREPIKALEPPPEPVKKIEPPVEKPMPLPVTQSKEFAPLTPVAPPKVEVPAPRPVEAPKVEAVKPEPAKVEPPKVEPVKAEPPKVDVPKAEAPRVEPARPPTPVPPAAEATRPAAPKAAEPAAPKAAEPAPRATLDATRAPDPAPTPRAPVPSADDIFGGRGTPPTSRDGVANPPGGAAPRIDLDAVRQRARDLGREGGTGQRGLIPFNVRQKEEHKTKEQQAFDKALKRADCKDAYADMGLAAVVPLIRDAITEKGCKWGGR